MILVMNSNYLDSLFKGVLRALGCKDSVAQMLLRGYRYAGE